MVKVEIIKANLKTNSKSVEQTKKKVCAYARVSTDSEEQLTSYSSQIKHYSTLIKTNPDWEFVGVYADEGISGTQIKHRDEFQRMIDEALNGKIDMIIAKSISRFARNTVDTLKIVRKLREKNIDVFFEKENIHTLLLDSEMFLTLYSAFAQAESESISMNVKMGLKAMMKRGEAVGRCECYGYNWNKETKQLEINKNQAEIVKRIFNLYVSKYGAKTIAKILNEENIPTYYGKKWSQATISDMIENEKYMGDLCGQKFYVTNPLTHRRVKNYGEKEKYYAINHHEAIISRELWEKAQEVKKKRTISNSTGHNSNCSMRYPFSSKICCGFCGTNFTRKAANKRADGSYTKYWACYQKQSDSKSCKDSVWIREETLEQIFVELYNSIVKNKYMTKSKLLNAIKETIKENNYQEQINKLELEEQKNKDRLSNLVDLMLDGSIGKEIYLSKEIELNEKISNITKKKNELINLNLENDNVEVKIKEIEKIVLGPNTIKQFDRDIFETIVDKIIVGEINKNGEKIPNVIKFVLKTGECYDTTFIDKKKRMERKKTESNMVQKGKENMV